LENIPWPRRGGELEDLLLGITDNSRIAELRYRFESPLQVIVYNADDLGKEISMPTASVIEIQQILEKWGSNLSR
jgi:hypothetical protein